jgi:hypothetical protein
VRSGPAWPVTGGARAVHGWDGPWHAAIGPHQRNITVSVVIELTAPIVCPFPAAGRRPAQTAATSLLDSSRAPGSQQTPRGAASLMLLAHTHWRGDKTIKKKKNMWEERLAAS